MRFTVVDPESRQALEAMTAYFDELEERFVDGFDPGDTLVSDAPGFRPPAGVFVIAVGATEDDTISCGGVQTISDGFCEIKRMWVAPQWRGRGVGRRMLAELESHGRLLGHHTVRLDTNSALTQAINMYETAGYRPIERYNDNPFAQRWFEKQLP
jgi:GNAT superfamily N-acetyltransferase